MTKKEILDASHGKMIISCQAVEGEPLYVEEKSIMYLMARAAKQAGTPAIRTSSIRDVVAIKEETELPVIGLVKIQYPGYEEYITPTMKEVDDLTAAGADVVALDCTLRKRGDGTTDNEFIAQIKEKYPDIIVADSKNFDGSKEIVEVFISLTPAILSSLTIIIHDILSYMKSRHKDDSKKQTDIEIEKKTADGEYKIIFKSSEVEDIDKAVAKTIQQIKKL